MDNKDLRYPIDFFEKKPGTSTENLEDKRYITFHCIDYKIKNKQTIDEVISEGNRLCSITLWMPSSFSENMEQSWASSQILSLASVSGKIFEKLKGDLLGTTAANLLTKKIGAVVNPAEELLYQGPGLRTFPFDYDFVPKSKEEEQMVKRILVALKRFSLPVISKDSLYVKFPPIWTFDIKGIEGNVDDSDFLMFGFKNKPMALTSCSINYMPEGMPTAFEDGFPVKISVSLTFQEIQPLYRDASENEDDMSQIEQKINEVEL